MFDLLDDGSIAIDFTPPDGEPVKVVVAPPPSFGAYKRVRGEVEKINEQRNALSAELRDDPDTTATVMNQTLATFVEDSAMRWWKFVIVGDDSYKGQAISGTPPEDPDSWPSYLASNEAVSQALGHWKSVPLARGGVRPDPTS